MPTTTPNTPVALTDTVLDDISGGLAKNWDTASPKLSELGATGYFRPSPTGDGTTEHFLTSLSEGETGL